MRKCLFIMLALSCVYKPANAIVQCVTNDDWIGHNTGTVGSQSEWSASYSNRNGEKIYGMATCGGYNQAVPYVYNSTSVGTDTTDFKVCLCMVLYPARTPWIAVYNYPDQSSCWSGCARMCAESMSSAAKTLVKQNFGF